MLSENDQRVYAEVRAAARRGERSTIASVSLGTGIPRSSVANTAVKLGYHGWTDMTAQLVRYYASLKRDDAVGDGVKVVAEALGRARGRAVLIDAVGDAEICLDYLLFRLCEFGFCAMPYSPGVIDSFCRDSKIAVVPSTSMSQQHEASAESPDALVRGGILVVINESGMSLMPSCVKAANAGLEVVAITASHDSPVPKLSQVNVVIKNNKSTLDAYEPNYFTAGVLAFMERALVACLE